MKRRHFPLIACFVAAHTLSAATLTWTGTTSGAWNPSIPANWSGVVPVFDNTADAVFNGATPITNYVTYLGDGPRTVRSISCLGTFASPFEIRTQNVDGTVARIAEQTKIISLNASNEAARAGSSGSVRSQPGITASSIRTDSQRMTAE